MSVVVNFIPTYLSGVVLWASYSGLSKIIVKFTPTPTYYLLLMFTAGLLFTTGLWATVNTTFQDPWSYFLWPLAGMMTDIPLILVYHIRSSCLFTLNREMKLALNIATAIFVGIVGGAHLTNLIQNFYYLVLPNGSWAYVGTTVYPIVDVCIPLYLVGTESIFIIQFYCWRQGNEENV
jgi:hypothetical protein